jgi:hypothetical protein
MGQPEGLIVVEVDETSTALAIAIASASADHWRRPRLDWDRNVDQQRGREPSGGPEPSCLFLAQQV